MTYTDRGLREILAGLMEAKGLLSQRRSDLQHKIGVMEVEVSALGKIEAALASAVEILRARQAEREKAEKEKA